ncbi:MAG TPA: VOC family protein [Gaiellaceae bacterium]|nr:VOC family protein [Gaiellaceae bacterium]
MAGKLVHFEAPSQDGDRARSFWSGVFGWEFQDAGMPDLDYNMVRTGEDQGGAVYTDTDTGGQGLVVYFDTDEIDASIAKVREHGGGAEDKQPIPNVGWFARCKDTEGNAFSLFQSDESVQMPA